MRRIGFALCLIASPAFADTPLPALNGQWSGSGTDRATPMQSLQPAQCRMQIKASQAQLMSTSVCDGAGGLKKRLKMEVTFSSNNFSGTVEQVSRQGDSDPTVYSGKITGRRTGDRAEMTASFPGFTPNVYVVLELASANSMAMKVTTLGSTLTDVTYRRR